MARNERKADNIVTGISFPLIEIFVIVTVGLITTVYLFYKSYKKYKEK